MLLQMCNYLTVRNMQTSLTSFTNRRQAEVCLPIVAALNALTFCAGLAACAFNSTAQCRLSNNEDGEINRLMNERLAYRQKAN